MIKCPKCGFKIKPNSARDEEIAKMRNEGATYVEIGEHFNICTNRARKTLIS